MVLTRPPSEMELTALVEFYERQHRRFEDGSLDATLVYGSKADNGELCTLATMTTLARLLFNLDETITKE